MRVSVSVELQPGPVAEVASASEPGVFHQVSRLPDGSWECDCRGYRYGARSDGLCRHIDGEREKREWFAALAFLLE